MALTDDIKAECKSRILAVGSLEAQMNLGIRLGICANLQPEHKTAECAQDLNDGDCWLCWVQDMRAACASLVLAQDATYAQEVHWPAMPAGLDTFMEKF